MTEEVTPPNPLEIPFNFYIGNNSIQTINTESVIIVVEMCGNKEL